MDYSAIVKDITQDVTTLTEKMMGYEGENGFAAVQEAVPELEKEISDLRERISRLMIDIQSELEAFPPEPSEEAFSFSRSLLDNLSTIETLLEWLNQQLDIAAQQAAPGRAASSTGGILATARGWLASVKSWLKRICKQLWQLISRLMTPKEWKLTGKVGTGVLGLAEVGIEITFG